MKHLMTQTKGVQGEAAAAPSLDDVICPICLSLLLEPVTLPCHHSLCLLCFQEHVSVTSLACPLCRTRISVWVRKNSKTNTLVDTKLWKSIKKHFPVQLEARLAGREYDSGILPEVTRRVSQPGEIRQEYESFLVQQTEEADQRKSKEEIASIKLIQELQEEEKQCQEDINQQQQHLAQEDFLLALQLEETDLAQIHTWQKEQQEMCAQDEDLARQLEVAESRSSTSAATGGSKGIMASPRGPMDLYLAPKGVNRGHHQQTSASVLGSTDTNTILPMEPSSSSNLKEVTLKRFPSNGSEQESDEPSSRHHPAPGKENLKRWWRGSPPQSGEGYRGKRTCHGTAQQESQLSPDIDSYSVTATTSLSRHQRSHRTSGEFRDGDSTSEDEEKGKAGEGEERCDSDDNLVGLPAANVSLLLKWDKDKESLEALLSEQKRAEAQLQQELQDRLLAEALQEELNNQARKVLRTKGTEDEYALRQRKKPTNHIQQQAGPSRSNGTKRQATLSEVLCKRKKSM